MTEEPNPRAVSGDNKPPFVRGGVVNQHDTKAMAFLDAAGEWLKLEKITNAADAEKLVDFIAGVKTIIKLVDEDRAKDKKPYDDAGKAVQRAYLPIMEKMQKAVDRVTPMQTAWLMKLRDEQRAEADAQRAAAAKATLAAEQLALQAASRNDISGEVDAEEAIKVAAAMKRDADRAYSAKPIVSSASGGARSASLREVKTVKITNIRFLFMALQEDPAVVEALLSAASARVRSKDYVDGSLPGIEVVITHKSV